MMCRCVFGPIRYQAWRPSLNGSGITGITLGNIMAPPVNPVVTWGSNADGQNEVPPLSGVAAVSAGSTHRLVLLNDGTVVSWGAGPAVPAGLTGMAVRIEGQQTRMVIGVLSNAAGRCPIARALFQLEASECLAFKSDSRAVRVLRWATRPSGVTRVTSAIRSSSCRMLRQVSATLFSATRISSRASQHSWT